MSVAKSSSSGLSVRTVFREDEDWAPRPARALIAEHVAEQRIWFAAIWREIQAGETLDVRATYGDWFFPVFWERPDGAWQRSPVAEDLAAFARRSGRDRNIAADGPRDARRVVAIDGPGDTRVVVSMDGGGLFARRSERSRRGPNRRGADDGWEVVRDVREIRRAIGHAYPHVSDYIAAVHHELSASTPSRSRDVAPRTLAMAFAYYGIRDVLGWRPSARSVLAWLERYDDRPAGRRDLKPACRLALRAMRGGQLTPEDRRILARAEDDVRRVCERARPRLGRFEP